MLQLIPFPSMQSVEAEAFNAEASAVDIVTVDVAVEAFASDAA